MLLKVEPKNFIILVPLVLLVGARDFDPVGWLALVYPHLKLEFPRAPEILLGPQHAVNHDINLWVKNQGVGFRCVSKVIVVVFIIGIILVIVVYAFGTLPVDGLYFLIAA